MKKIKYFKIIDLVFSIIFLFLFFYKNGIAASYEYGLGQLIKLFVLLPVAILLFVSIIMSIIAIFDKQNVFIFSIIGQVLKIISYLLYIIICFFGLHIKLKIDFLIMILIYGIIFLTILSILSCNYKKGKVEKNEK